jgi:1,4-alpha-glucan branching enzyme
VVSYWRSDGQKGLIVVLNLTPVPRDNYRIGAPVAGRYLERFCSDDKKYGGSDVETYTQVFTDPVAFHGYAQSLALRLPPLGAVVLEPVS